MVGCHSHDKLPAIGDAVPPAPCPTHLDFELNGASSRFDPGFSGLAHGVGLADHTRFSAEVYGHDDTCRRVQFRGPVPPDPARNPVQSRRCLHDLTTICTADTDCVDGSGMDTGPCRYILPPISSTLGLPTCAIAFLSPVNDPLDDSPVEGVLDLATGEMDMARFNIYIDIYVGKCPECRGDTSHFDGVQDGTCYDTNDMPLGTLCDVAGLGTQQAAATSYDCPPADTPLTRITLASTDATTSDRAWTMDATRPGCTSAMYSVGQNCWCGMCGDGATCTSDDDCAIGSCGVGSAGSGSAAVTFSTANNSCAAGNSCQWDSATQTGRCTNETDHACFPDSGTIIAHGSAEVRSPGVYNSQISNLICLPNVGGGAFGGLIDGGAGFPGPLLFQARFTVQTRVSP